MLSKEDSELLTRVAAGTPMGSLMRRYWMPALLSWELPEPDCPPVRARLLGEDLVAFRDTEGTVGLLGAHCPHRGASLFFGRSEEHGLRCVYHGWKYDVSGNCVDMPNEPAEGAQHAVLLQQKIRHRAYPCVDRGGVIWTYMGPPELKPGLPELEWSALPEPQRFHSKRHQECNWLQAMEGGIDSSHISFLHSGQPPLKRRPAVASDERTNQPTPRVLASALGPAERSDPAAAVSRRSIASDRGFHVRDSAPHFEIVDTDYGLLIGARRTVDEDSYYWRITQWLFPWYTMIPPFGDGGIGGHAWVPIDDERCWAWSFSWHPVRPYPPEQIEGMRNGAGIHSILIPGTFKPVANRDNDYLIDREKQRYVNFTGIDGIGTQDCAVQEGMGAIYDRSTEHLGTSDTAIIAARRRLLAALKGYQEGIEPPALDPELYRVRSYSTVLPKDVAWAEGAKDGLVARPGVFLASV